jgi:predicted metal-binding membrane protein
LGSWRDGLSGALTMGARHGAWCVGCCWALMASLFALGVMSLAWMAFVAALIALEKTLPWGRAVTYGTAALLLALGVLLLAAPDAIPGLTLPDQDGGMDSMRMMS